MATLLVTLFPVAMSAQECQEQVSDGGFYECTRGRCYWWVYYARGGNITHKWIPDGESHPHVFWYQRYGRSRCVKGAVWAWQGRHTEFGVWPRKPPLSDWQDIEVSDYSALSLELDVKVISYSSNGSGEEFPCQLILDYEGTDGIAYRWNHGFLPNADTFGRTNYTQVTPGKWYHYGPVNIIDVIDSPSPARITRITVGGNGCDFEAMIDNVSLCGIPETADGCLPMAKFKIDKAKLDFKDTGKCGGIASMTLDYSGGAGADITVDKGTVTDNGDGTYTITPEDGKEKLHSEIRLEIDGDEVAKIHTSCSKPINVGDVHGDFEIVELDTLPPKHDEGDKVEVNGKLVPCDGPDITKPVIVEVGPLSETIFMKEKKDKWEYKRPKGVVGSIKEMKIDWKKGTFEIKMDNADLTGITNPVTIGIQIGDCCGEETIEMKEEKHHWDYK